MSPDEILKKYFLVCFIVNSFNQLQKTTTQKYANNMVWLFTINAMSGAFDPDLEDLFQKSL